MDYLQHLIKYKHYMCTNKSEKGIYSHEIRVRFLTGALAIADLRTTPRGIQSKKSRSSYSALLPISLKKYFAQ